jgi:hypothetical protein
MSKLVKIVLVQSIDCDDHYTQAIIRESINDWEEVSDEDFVFLEKNIYRIVEAPYGFYPKLIIKDHVPVTQRISSIRTLIAEEQAAQAAEKERRKAAEQARQQKRMLKKAESELALLEQLKKKYEDNA